MITMEATSGTGDRELTATRAYCVQVESLNEAPAGLPTISGAVQAGRTLTADDSSIADPDGPPSGQPSLPFSYQWNQGAAADTATTIDGATLSSCEVQDGDGGLRLSVTVI